MIARARKVLAAVAAEPNGWHAGQVLSVESEPIVYLELARKRERKQSVRLDEGRKRGRNVSHYREGTSRCYCRYKETLSRMRRVPSMRIRSLVGEFKKKREIFLRLSRKLAEFGLFGPRGDDLMELPFRRNYRLWRTDETILKIRSAT